MGTCVHDGLAAIARGLPIDDIANTAQKQMFEALTIQTSGEVSEIDFANEQAALVEGILRGFYKYVWPRLMVEYPVIKCVEVELTYEHDGLTFMSKPDLVVVGVNWEGELTYIEYKTTNSKTDEWVNAWDTAIQIHSSIRAIEATTNEKVANVTVIGLYKGFESYGKQSSPFCYAYKKIGTPPFTETLVQYEYKTGFKRYPTWELEGGVKAWVDGMPDEVLGKQFLQTPPIFVKDDMVDTFFKQRAIREHEIIMANVMLKDETVDEETKRFVLNTTFPQRFDQCKPGYGRLKPCEYMRICHGHVVDPLNEGFEYRVPHHELEAKQFEELYGI